MLDCIDKILTNFEFYNKASIQDVRDTIQAGCGYGQERGDIYSSFPNDFSLQKYHLESENFIARYHAWLFF